MLLAFLSTGAGCARVQDFDKSLGAIIKPHQLSIVRWELNAFGGWVSQIFRGKVTRADNGTAAVTEYFATAERINRLVPAIDAIKTGDRHGDLASLEAELSKLRRQNTESTDTVEKILETQIRETLSQEGIFNPMVGLKFGFPAVNFKLEAPPHLLVISPRDRIETVEKVTLVPGMSTEDMESIEDKVDKLGVSSLVVEIGGFATYPSYVTTRGDLRFTLDSVAHEWVHLYLAFKPLGFRYLLEQIGITHNYEIATMNESLASMVGREIGSMTYNRYYAQGGTAKTAKEATSGFDFNQEMREIRRTVDSYLAQGQIEQAEKFMEEKRQYLSTKGYYIRKLNQAYFAYYGTYADSPASINPIGAELKKMRSQSASLKDFLDTVASMTSRQDLAQRANR